MNILLINHYAGSPRHGMEYRPYYLAREWVRLGHQVQIVAASWSHVRSVQPVEPKRVTRGKEVYVRLCQLCHLEEGRSTTYADYPLLAGQSLPYMLKEIKLILDKRRRVELIKLGVAEAINKDDLDSGSIGKIMLDLAEKLKAHADKT